MRGEGTGVTTTAVDERCDRCGHEFTPSEVRFFKDGKKKLCYLCFHPTNEWPKG